MLVIIESCWFSWAVIRFCAVVTCRKPSTEHMRAQCVQIGFAKNTNDPLFANAHLSANSSTQYALCVRTDENGESAQQQQQKDASTQVVCGNRVGVLLGRCQTTVGTPQSGEIVERREPSSSDRMRDVGHAIADPFCARLCSVAPICTSQQNTNAAACKHIWYTIPMMMIAL